MRLLMVVTLLAGCTSVEYVKDADGDDALSITCTHNITYCYNEASNNCPHGYVVLDKTVGRKATMLISCKD